MNRDYIPGADALFHNWQTQFINGVQPNIVAWKIDAPDFNALLPLQTAWEAAWQAVSDVNSFTRADVQAKVDARKAYEKALRSFVQEWISPNKNITDAQRRDIGVTVADTEPTAVPRLNYPPALRIDRIGTRMHVLRFSDPQNPASRALPQRQQIMLERFVGEANLPPDGINFGNADVITRALSDVEFVAADAGKTVYYRSCFVNTRGEKSPWSDTVTGIVA